MVWINLVPIFLLLAVAATSLSTELRDSTKSQQQTHQSLSSTPDSNLLQEAHNKTISLDSTSSVPEKITTSDYEDHTNELSSSTKTKELMEKDSTTKKSYVQSGPTFRLIVETSTDSSEGTTTSLHQLSSKKSASVPNDKSPGTSTSTSQQGMTNGDSTSSSKEITTTHQLSDDISDHHSTAKRSVDTRELPKESTTNEDISSDETHNPTPSAIESSSKEIITSTNQDISTDKPHDNTSLFTSAAYSEYEKDPKVASNDTVSSTQSEKETVDSQKIKNENISDIVTSTQTSGNANLSLPKVSRSQRSSESKLLVSPSIHEPDEHSSNGNISPTKNVHSLISTAMIQDDIITTMISSSADVVDLSNPVNNSPTTSDTKRAQAGDENKLEFMATTIPNFSSRSDDLQSFENSTANQMETAPAINLENGTSAESISHNESLNLDDSITTPITVQDMSNEFTKKLISGAPLSADVTSVLAPITESSMPTAKISKSNLDDMMMNDSPQDTSNTTEKGISFVPVKISSSAETSDDLNVTKAPLTIKAPLMNLNANDTALLIVGSSTVSVSYSAIKSTSDVSTSGSSFNETSMENNTNIDENIANGSAERNFSLESSEEKVSFNETVRAVDTENVNGSIPTLSTTGDLNINGSSFPTSEGNVSTTTPETTTKGFRIRKPKIRGDSSATESKTRSSSFLKSSTPPTQGPPVSIFKKDRTRRPSITSSTTRGPWTTYSYNFNRVTASPRRIIGTEVPDLSFLSTTLPPPPPTTTEAEEEEDVIEEVYPEENVDNIPVPTASDDDDVTLIKIAAATRVAKGIKWRIQLNNRESIEYKEQARKMQQTLRQLFHHTPVSPVLWKIEIDGFSEDITSRRRVQVDYFLFVIKTDQIFDGPILSRIFNQKLINNSFGRYRFEPEFTQFDIIHEEKLNPPKEEPELDPNIPQWAIAVIVIGAASFIFIILFAAVTVYGRHHMRRRYAGKLDEDLERSVDSMDWEKRLGVAAAYENLAADGIYDADDSSIENTKRRYVPPNPPRNPRMRHYDSWRTVWTEPPKRARLPVNHLTNF